MSDKIHGSLEMGGIVILFVRQESVLEKRGDGGVK